MYGTHNAVLSLGSGEYLEVLLLDLLLGTPEPDELRDRLARYGSDPRVSVEHAPAPALTATFRTPRGEVAL